MISVPRYLAAARPARSMSAFLLTLLGASVLAGCGGQIGGARTGGGDAGGPPGQGPTPARGPDPQPGPEVIRSYERAGMITNLGPFPFIGSVAYLAGPTPDSTLTLITLSFAARVLTFARENDEYRGSYEARVEVNRGDSLLRRVPGTQTVRVATYPETARLTESVIFQQALNLVPGKYSITIYLRDVGSPRASSKGFPITVPAIGPTSLSTPLAVYQASPRNQTDSMPRVIASPRATATFGRDTVVDLYLEGYGAGPDLPVAASIRSGLADDGDTATVWADTIAFPRHGSLFSGVAVVPTSRIGIGPATLLFHRTDAGAGDTVRAAIFVGFGEDLPIGSWDDMVNYLKYFPAHQRVDALRNVPPAQRAAAWARFVRETDPIPSTPQNEALDSYIQRLRQANERFTGEGIPGWQTDRGMVFITAGEPDRAYTQGATRFSARGTQIVWTYRQYKTELTFERVNGRYKLNTHDLSKFEAMVKHMVESPPPPAAQQGQ
jgi:GWxTD domain-containing protein